MTDHATSLVDQLRPFLRDEAASGRLRVDLNDLAAICVWFLRILNESQDRRLSPDELESLLIDLETNLIEHGSFHLRSMKTEIGAALRKLAEVADDNVRHDAVQNEAGVG